MSENMIHLLDRIVDCGGNKNGNFGLDYYNQFSEELQKYEFSQILAYLSSQNKFSVSEILEFILSTPYLWQHFSVYDWIEVMSSLNPQSNPFTIEIFNIGYSDIHFLCKYLRINAIDLFIKQEKFSNKDKKRVLQYSKKIGVSLFMDELDLEDLDGDYLVDYNTIKKVKSNLIFNQKVKPMISTSQKLVEYLDNRLVEFKKIVS